VILSPVSLSVAWDVRVIRVISLGVFGLFGFVRLLFRRLFEMVDFLIVINGLRVNVFILQLLRFLALL
jgi:hypothetical protein